MQKTICDKCQADASVREKPHDFCAHHAAEQKRWLSDAELNFSVLEGEISGLQQVNAELRETNEQLRGELQRTYSVADLEAPLTELLNNWALRIEAGTHELELPLRELTELLTGLQWFASPREKPLQEPPVLASPAGP